MTHFSALHLLKMFSSNELQPPAWRPPADVYRTRRGWLLKFELAGVRMNDITFEISGRTVRLWGTRRDLVCTRTHEHHGMEIAYGSFERSVELPCDLSQAKISAQTSDGMLLIQIETP